MKKIILILVLLALPLMCFAETIVLKSGKTVEGKIIERTDQYVKIEFQGIGLTYFLEDVESIDGIASMDLSKKQDVIANKDTENKSYSSRQEEYLKEDLGYKEWHLKGSEDKPIALSDIPYLISEASRKVQCQCQGREDDFSVPSLEYKCNRGADTIKFWVRIFASAEKAHETIIRYF